MILNISLANNNIGLNDGPWCTITQWTGCTLLV